MPLCKWHTFWMVPCLIRYFIVILLYTEWKWLLVINFTHNLSHNLTLEVEMIWKILAFPCFVRFFCLFVDVCFEVSVAVVVAFFSVCLFLFFPRRIKVRWGDNHLLVGKRKITFLNLELYINFECSTEVWL